MATVGFPSPPAKLCGHRSFSSTRLASPARRAILWVRCSAEAAPETSSATNGENEGWSGGASSESPVGTSRRYSSLISAENVQKALRGVAITDADHYGRLGIARGTSYDEVGVAYKRKCEELMNKELDEEDANQKMSLLKESYEILSSEEERRLYDWSLARTENPDRYLWPFEADITQIPTQSPPPQEPEDVGPTRLVGYFFLTWLILSFALSVTLNR